MPYDDRLAEYLLKVVCVGCSRVGKSSLLLRYCDDMFSDKHACTIGVDFRLKELLIDGSAVKMQLWDTAGQERFRTIVPVFYRGAEGLVIVFDVSDEESFRMVPSWIEEAAIYSQEDCVRILVGNKTDIKRRVDTKTAQALADSYGLKYVETSAKTASNVHAAFDSLARTILDKKMKEACTSLTDSSTGRSILLESQDLSQPPGWCYWGSSFCYSE